MNAAPRFDFRELACVLLGGVCGFLASIPLVLSDILPAKFALIPIFTIGGSLVGYRRRKSVVFFYFVLIAILVLTSILVFQLEKF